MRIRWIVLILGTAVLVGSCGGSGSGKKKAKPGIDAINPATGDVAGGETVTVVTSGFRDDFTRHLPEVYFGTDAAAVTAVDSRTASAVTPAHAVAEAVDVEVRSTGKIQTARATAGYTYTAGPVLCSVTVVTPDQGDPAGGETVTIDGSGFDRPPLPTPDVSFGGISSPSASVISDTQIQALTPAGSVGVVDVTVTTQSGPCTLPGGFEYVAGPTGCTITAVTPGQGSVVGGDVVTIDGSGFDTPPLPTPGVTFGGVASPFVLVVSDAEIQAETPAGAAAGTVDVAVTVQAGTCALPGGFEYLAGGPCTITGVTPDQGYTDEVTTVFVDGTSFDLPPLPAPTVQFGAGNFGSGVTVIDPSRLVVDAPTVAGAGPVDVTVTTQAGPCTLPAGFEYLPPLPPPSCTITSIDPTFGPDFGGNPVTIHGSGFSAVSRVWVDGNEITPVGVVSPTELRITAPAGSGTVGVQADIGGGTTCDLPSSYTYISCTGPSCQLQRVNPDTGGAGDTVTIEGNQFENQALVFFGNAPDLVPAVVTDYSGVPGAIVVQVPPRLGVDPLVDVEVMNPSGSCCSRANAFTYSGCLVQSMSPDSGTAAGGTNITMTGQGFTASGGDVPEVWFGTEPASIVIPITTTQLVVLSPPAGNDNVVEVRLVYPSGDTCSYCCYTYHGCVVDAVVPDSGGTNGGDPVEIQGWGFSPQGLHVTFGGIHAHPDFVTVNPTGTVIDLIAPPSFTGGAKDVRVWNESPWTECILAQGYTYLLPGASSCTITSIDPPRGCISGGGRSITIRGTGFDADTGVIFDVMPSPQVTFISPTEIQAELPIYVGPMPPPPTPPNPIEVVVDVVVAPRTSDPCIASGGFTYFQPTICGGCSIAGLAPGSGPAAGGNTITLTGAGFCECGHQVRFGTEPGQVVWNDATNMTVVVPPSVTGTGPVDVTYRDGSGCEVTCVGCYTYN